MPAVTAPDLLILPRVHRPHATSAPRPVARVVEGLATLEGEGFPVRRPFPGRLNLHDTDPFLLLDHMGAVEYGPGEPKGTAWHPHRGFETVTYIVDGAFAHRDSIGGGGLIADGATQWMTAGAGILHIETPPEELVVTGGLFHGVQLWVNLPAADKMTDPRYQDIGAESVRLLASDDGGALLRLIAGDIAGFAGPGRTHTPIAYLHATIPAGGRLELPWDPTFNAMAYALSGRGTAGVERAPFGEGRLVLFGAGDHLILEADGSQDARTPDLELLILGGRPIGEPIVHYGPFVMNTKDEVIAALEDYQAGRFGQIPVESA